MKNSSQFINDSVFKINRRYNYLQNKTKELFFRCLDEERDLDYFKNELKKIWGNTNLSLMEQELDDYEAMIHENNMAMLQIQETTPEEAKETNDFFTLVAGAVILATEKKFTDYVTKDYERTLKSHAYIQNKIGYLSKRVTTYKDEKVVPYYVTNKETGEVTIRHVSLAAYNSMIFNTNMTRTAWNTTLNDADRLGYKVFYIPYHSFSCPHCIAHQERPIPQEEILEWVDKIEEQEGDILHPNCKCTLLIYDIAKKEISPYSDYEKEEFYHTRQKINSLTLEKSRIWTDMKIQKSLGEMGEWDKLNQKRNKINSQIRELKNSLPTEELQKQVVAINR